MAELDNRFSYDEFATGTEKERDRSLANGRTRLRGGHRLADILALYGHRLDP